MRNSSLVQGFCAENVTGLKSATEASDDLDHGRGALPVRRRYTERGAGALASENAGISSDKAGENPARRKPKVSWGRFVRPG